MCISYFVGGDSIRLGSCFLENQMLVFGFEVGVEFIFWININEVVNKSCIPSDKLSSIKSKQL